MKYVFQCLTSFDFSLYTMTVICAACITWFSLPVEAIQSKEISNLLAFCVWYIPLSSLIIRFREKHKYFVALDTQKNEIISQLEAALNAAIEMLNAVGSQKEFNKGNGYDPKLRFCILLRKGEDLIKFTHFIGYQEPTIEDNIGKVIPVSKGAVGRCVREGEGYFDYMKDGDDPIHFRVQNHGYTAAEAKKLTLGVKCWGVMPVRYEADQKHVDIILYSDSHDANYYGQEHIANERKKALLGLAEGLIDFFRKNHGKFAPEVQ